MQQVYTVPFRGIAAQAVHYPPSYAVGAPHIHHGLELYCQTEGSSRFFVGDACCPLRPGSLVLMAAGQPHRLEVVGPAACRGLELHFGARQLAELENAFPQADIGGLLPPGGPWLLDALDWEQQALVEGLLRQLLRLQEQNGQRGTAARLLLLGALLCGLQPLWANAHPPAPHCTAMDIVAELQGYLAVQYAQHITLAGLAQRYGISACYLSRVFKQYTGVGLVQYLTAVRVKAAQALLRQGHRSADVAAQCGFGTAAQFRRVFKAAVGVSPRQYRSRSGA